METRPHTPALVWRKGSFLRVRRRVVIIKRRRIFFAAALEAGAHAVLLEPLAAVPDHPAVIFIDRL
jgi:hypothetical protein